MNISLRHSHNPGDRVRIKDGPSSSFAYPFVGIAGVRECVFLQCVIWSECCNCLQHCAMIVPEMGKINNLFQQFMGKHLPLDQVTKLPLVTGDCCEVLNSP